jgi:glycosyltransferase involved in cell wall biosynthesis
MKIVIIIPAYNEEQTIAATIEDFYHAAPSNEIIVVDNNSKDATFDIATTTLQKLRAAGRVIIEREHGNLMPSAEPLWILMRIYI